ncbi:MAG: hypothetical protein WD534_15695 [Phycisphaeraceae bacterium]
MPEPSPDPDKPSEGPWAPRHGLITRLIVWAILVGFGLTLLAMIAIILFD